jgi:alpha-L-arabinofuranosidase
LKSRIPEKKSKLKNSQMKRIASFLSFLLYGLAGSVLIYPQARHTVVINAGKPIADIQPTMWGLFFEDINFAADGGLYAEMIKNRSFEFDSPMMGWKTISDNNTIGRFLIINDEHEVNSHYVRLQTYAGDAVYGIANEGFRGIGVRAGDTCIFSVSARMCTKDKAKLQVALIDSLGSILGQTAVEVNSGDWKTYKASFIATATCSKARLSVSLVGPNTTDIDMVSLFPKATWKNRPNGLRKDLVQLLADMKPGFIRFPGGCIVEGRTLPNRYQWKNTLGDPANRKLIINRWNTEFANRSTPDYFQSYGLGFYEYFLLAEDIGAQPLPIMNCGMACQFNSSELVPMENLDPYIQDVLDLIEFANGPVTGKWGKMRAAMGHPLPFNLKMVGIGNEQWGPQYIERYALFARAIKKQYPDIKLVSGAGPNPDGSLFDFSWSELRKMNADLIDEHYYRSPDWFRQNASRYDHYDRQGPRVFAGEYAAHSTLTTVAEKKNNWESALAEAAFMTGLERNADIVFMASYAPLFAHIEGWQWSPDLIWFDNLKSYGTPNYYVQKMFATNRGTTAVPAFMNGAAVGGQDSLYITSCLDKTTNELIIKMVNVSSRPASLDISLEGLKSVEKDAMEQVLVSNDLKMVNSLQVPAAVTPVDRKIILKGKKFGVSLDARSFSVLKVHYKE